MTHLTSLTGLTMILETGDNATYYHFAKGPAYTVIALADDWQVLAIYEFTDLQHFLDTQTHYDMGDTFGL